MDEIRFICPISNDEFIFSVERFRRKYPKKQEDMDYYFTLTTLRNGGVDLYGVYCRENGMISEGDLVVIPKEDLNAKKVNMYVMGWYKDYCIACAKADSTEEIMEKLESLVIAESGA
jgi:hypothetical protein